MFIRLTTIVLCLWGIILPLAGKELKVLMIGNSFSTSVGKHLPQIVNSVPGHTLELTCAYIGGCPLDRHSKNLRKAEHSAGHTPYQITVWRSNQQPHRQKTFSGNINSLLKNYQYDVITIQQSSSKSFIADSYEPYAAEIIQYIRKYQKNAEIVIQQTWAYRSDSPRFAKWNITQEDMYQQLKSAYALLAARYHLRVIPTGYAVQLYRQFSPNKYQKTDRKFEYPALPSDAGDPVGKFAWRTNKKTGKYILNSDCHHLNSRGEYMQGLLWFAFLFQEPVSRVTYQPENLAIQPEEVQLLKKCAQTALNDYPQVTR